MFFFPRYLTGGLFGCNLRGCSTFACALILKKICILLEKKNYILVEKRGDMTILLVEILYPYTHIVFLLLGALIGPYSNTLVVLGIHIHSSCMATFLNLGYATNFCLRFQAIT
jgi:hypothetical protein